MNVIPEQIIFIRQAVAAVFLFQLYCTNLKKFLYKIKLKFTVDVVNFSFNLKKLC